MQVEKPTIPMVHLSSPIPGDPCWWTVSRIGLFLWAWCSGKAELERQETWGLGLCDIYGITILSRLQFFHVKVKRGW